MFSTSITINISSKDFYMALLNACIYGLEMFSKNFHFGRLAFYRIYFLYQWDNKPILWSLLGVYRLLLHVLVLDLATANN